MNRKSINNKVRKEMEKEVKKGQSKLSKAEPLKTDVLTPKKALKKYPAKIQKIEKPLMDAVVKDMQIKKKKKTAKNSKRTTPGDVDHRESSPAHIHTENERWQQTLKKKSVGKRKSLTLKLQKRSQKKRK